MMDQSRGGPAMLERHLQGVNDELCAHVVGHRPAHDPAREDVLDGGQVEPALPGSEVGDVRDPEPVRPVSRERAIDKVLADANARARGSSCDRAGAGPGR